jgi:DNA repair protein RadC
MSSRWSKYYKPFNSTLEHKGETPKVKERTSKAKEADDEKKLTIKEWNEEERPREKLESKGPESLTKAELLAILIGSGTKKKSAVELMAELMRECDDKLVLLSRMSIDELTQISGIGPAKAITIEAAMELGNRRTQEETTVVLEQIKDAGQIYRYMHPLMRDLNYEECWALLLNNNARLIKRVKLSQGGRTETLVDVRILLKHALLAEATSMILVHNHPSGSCRPSKEDIRLTEHVKTAGTTMNIKLLDHVIVTDGDYYSFSEDGKL